MSIKKTPQQILEEAFADFDTRSSRVTASEIDETDETGAEELEPGYEDGQEDGDEESSFDLGDESAEGEFDPHAISEEDEEAVAAPVEEEEEGPGTEPFSLDEDASEDDEEDLESGEAPEGSVYASVEEVEAEMQAIAREQGLHKMPQGVTAAETIDYLLSTNAIVELKPITASERKQRHAAFAADEGFEGEEAEELVESPVDLEEDDSSIDEGEELGSEFDGIDLSDVAETEDDEDSSEDAGSEVESGEGPECATASVRSGVQYHPVADVGFLASASAADVQMIFSNGADPLWNIIVAGVPAACIKLSSLDNGAAVRSTFCSDLYSGNLIQAMAKHGVAEVIASVKGEFYANGYKSSDLAGEIRASVAEELSSDYTNRVVAMREDLLDRSSLVVAGLARGYFSKLQNPLLAKAKSVLSAQGVHPSVIEAAASEIVSAAPDFFAVATEKAVELMDKSPEFIESLRENIEDSAPRAVASATTASFESRLADQTLANPAPVVASTATHGDFRSHLSSLVGTLGRKR